MWVIIFSFYFFGREREVKKELVRVLYLSPFKHILSEISTETIT